MKRKVLVLALGISTFVLLGLNSALATCSNDPNDSLVCDTVVVDEVQGVRASSHAVVNVSIWNDEHVGTFVIPLAFPDTLPPYLDVTLDSVSFVGTRSTTAALKTDASSIDNAKDRVVVYAIWFSGDLAPGSGVVAKLYFTTGSSWVAPNNYCDIDTVFFSPSISYQLVDPTGVTAWTPVFERGAIVHVPNVTTPNLPTDFSLSQNYPNPFNASTAITFSLKEDGPVTFRILNLLGQKVATLLDGQYKKSGTYSVTWDGKTDDGSPVSSGVYFYTIKTTNFNQCKKMVVVK